MWQGNSAPNSARWECRGAGMNDFICGNKELIELWGLYWEEGKDCPEYRSWLTKWKAAWPKPPLRSLKEWRLKQLLQTRKIALANPPDILTEQSMNFLPLPVNPDTGELNPNSLPLESIWILESLLDPIITDPANNITKKLNDPEAIHVPVDFTITAKKVRKKLGRRFSNAEQLRAFTSLRRWEIVRQYCWDTTKGKRGTWTPYKMEEGTVFAYQWKVTEMRRAGGKDKAGKQVDYVFSGMISPVVGFLLLWNLAHHRIRPIPQKVYRMSEGAQLLYRQGLPFILNVWRLKYDVACRILGYSVEGEVKDQPGMISGYLDEIVKVVGWRRDKRSESGRGHDGIWVLKASKKETKEQWLRRYHRDKIERARKEFALPPSNT